MRNQLDTRQATVPEIQACEVFQNSILKSLELGTTSHSFYKKRLKLANLALLATVGWLSTRLGEVNKTLPELVNQFKRTEYYQRLGAFEQPMALDVFRRTIEKCRNDRELKWLLERCEVATLADLKDKLGTLGQAAREAYAKQQQEVGHG